MIKDLLISFKDNFTQKTRNPFLGTYVIVWCIRNWELLYTLFNFDEGHDLKHKTEFIKTYYSETPYWGDVLINIFWAYIVLIVTYILLNVSRYIVNISEKRLTPWVYKMSDYKSLVTKEAFDQLMSQNNHLEGLVEKERQAKNRLQSDYDKLEERYEAAIQKGSNLPSAVEQPLFPEKEEIDEAEVFYQKVKKRGYGREFLRLVVESQKGLINNIQTESVDYFNQLGLIKIEPFQEGNYSVEVTPIGRQVLNKIRLEIE